LDKLRPAALGASKSAAVYRSNVVLRLLLSLLLTSCLWASVDEAKQLIQSGQFREALLACDRDLKATPNDARIWTLKGMAFRGLGDAAQARDALRRALRLEPKFLPALQNLAQVEYEQRDPRCQKTVEQIVALRPDDSVAHAMLGALAMERRDCVSGIVQYGKAGQAAENPVVRWQLGACYFQAARWRDAEAEFQALLAGKEDPGVRFNLALVQLQAGSPKEAIDTLRPLAQKPEAEPDVLSLLASAYEANGQTPESLNVLQDAIRRYPRDERLYTELAGECLDHSAAQLGIEVLETGARNLPKSARIQTMLGILEARSGKTDAAKASFARAGQMGPDAALASVAFAVSLMQQGAVFQAVSILQDQLARDPQSVPVRETLAQALLQKGHSEEDLKLAQRLLLSVIKENPNEQRAYTTLGKVYAARNEIAKARDSLEKALSLDSEDLTATYQLMAVYKRLDRKEDAVRLAVKVRELLAKQRGEEQENSRYSLVRAPER